MKTLSLWLFYLAGLIGGYGAFGDRAHHWWWTGVSCILVLTGTFASDRAKAKS